MKLKIFSALLTLFLSTITHALSPILAGGTYYYEHNGKEVGSLYILKSENNGDNWIATNPIKALSNKKDPLLQKLACGSKACIATSLYRKNNRSGWSGNLLTSTDSGLTWHVVNKEIINLPENLRDYRLSSLDCNNNICLAAGIFNSPHRSNMILASKDGGIHWRLEYLNFLGYPSDITCTKNYCVVTTLYRKKNNYYPAFLKYDILHDTWSRGTVSGIPDNYHAMYELKTSCKNDTCVVSGWDAFSTPGINGFTSHDQGNTWSYIKNVKGLPRETAYYQLTGNSCTSNYCVVIGERYYKINDKAVSAPFSMKSIDGGKTWQVSTFNDIPEQDTFSHPVINCDKNICIVSGHATNNNYLTISYDSGLTWQSIKNLPPIPSTFNAIGLYANKISNNNLIVMGHGWNNEGKGSIFSLVSHDYGNTWTLSQKFEGMDPKATRTYINTMTK